VDRLSVGLGMVPRGEVGLIFANIGLMLSVGEHPLLDATTYSAIVAMVILTTLVTPPALKWSFGRGRHAARAA
jgi:Kef-type K+ transport system membrane component KefB